MSPKIVIYELEGNNRAKTMCQAMAKGFYRLGINFDYLRDVDYYHTGSKYNVAIFYGLAGRLKRVFDEFPMAGKKAVYIDLGYWGRTEGGKREGYHKISVNGRHPTDYFQKRVHSAKRFERFKIKIEPWNIGGRHILLAGMGNKAAMIEGYRTEQWERMAIGKIRLVSDRPIIYRPKPSFKSAQPIIGVEYSDPVKEQDINAVLQNCHAVVTHHSNVSVDGLVKGIPAFCDQGVAVPMSLSDLSRIEEPIHPDGREQWAADIAWTQWKVDEMREGLVWRYLVDEGLV